MRVAPARAFCSFFPPCTHWGNIRTAPQRWILSPRTASSPSSGTRFLMSSLGAAGGQLRAVSRGGRSGVPGGQPVQRGRRSRLGFLVRTRSGVRGRDPDPRPWERCLCGCLGGPFGLGAAPQQTPRAAFCRRPSRPHLACARLSTPRGGARAAPDGGAPSRRPGAATTRRLAAPSPRSWSA